MSGSTFSFANSKGQARSSGAGSSPSTSASNSVFEAFPVDSKSQLSNFQKDMLLINQKIADLLGSSTQISSPISSPMGSSSSTSSFVQSLRSLTSSDNIKDEKNNQLHQLINKITELDRIVLKKTSYIDNQNSSQSIRRKQGSDLSMLPTHMNVIDRLLDLYAYYRRPLIDHSDSGTGNSNGSSSSNGNSNSNGNGGTVSAKVSIRQGASTKNPLTINGESMGTPRNTNDDNLQEKIDRLKKFLEDSESKRKNLETDNIKLRKKVQGLQGEISLLKEKLSILEGESNVSSQYIDEIQSLKTLLQASRDQHADCISNFQSMIVNKTAHLNQSTVTDIHFNSETNYNNYNLTHGIREAMGQFDEALTKRMSDYAIEIDSLLAIKSTFEIELGSYHREKAQYQADIVKLTEDYQALKIAFAGLESESIRSQTQYTTDANEKIRKLSDDLRDARTSISSLELITNKVSDLNHRLLESERQKISDDTMIRQLRDEIEAYKRLNESLKNKIRSMSSSDGKEFLDTFEEVMRDEMMTMKTAFEAKLRSAKEEADELSRKHMIEINRMKSFSSGLGTTIVPSLSTQTSSSKVIIKSFPSTPKSSHE